MICVTLEAMAQCRHEESVVASAASQLAVGHHQVRLGWRVNALNVSTLRADAASQAELGEVSQ